MVSLFIKAYSCSFTVRSRRQYEIHTGTLGHSSKQITADVYSHISKKIEQDRMNKFEEHKKNVHEQFF